MNLTCTAYHCGTFIEAEIMEEWLMRTRAKAESFFVYDSGRLQRPDSIYYSTST